MSIDGGNFVDQANIDVTGSAKFGKKPKRKMCKSLERTKGTTKARQNQTFDISLKVIWRLRRWMRLI